MITEIISRTTKKPADARVGRPYRL